jgi:hypothetical protein
MRAVAVRLLMLAAGMAAVEIAIGSTPGTPPIIVGLVLAIGLIGVVAGSAGFMVPLLGQAAQRGSK